MGKKKDIYIPVIKDGKDICRLIFMKANDGKYDLKIEFLNNAFGVQTYRLFSYRPIVWDVENLEKVNISYHHGANNYPVMIHLKRKEPENGVKTYTTLPPTRIQAPNINQMFPIPLLKLEIPQSVVEGAKEYTPKSYHHAIDIEDSNVLELYMSAEDNSLIENIEKYPKLSFVQTAMSMEYFATNSVVSDYQKNPNFVPKGKERLAMMVIKELQGMDIGVNIFPDPDLDRREKALKITFIENELAEEILLSTILRYPKVNLQPGVYDYTLMGGANLKQLQPDNLLLLKPALCPESAASYQLKSNTLTSGEKEKLKLRAMQAQNKLYGEMIAFDKRLNAEKEELMEKALEFMELFHKSRARIRKEKPKPAIGEIYYLTDVEAWLLSHSSVHAEEMHLLFAKFLGRDRCQLFNRVICQKNTQFNHVWMMYDDMLDVDLLRGNLNLFFDEEGTEPDILIDRGTTSMNADNWNGMKKRLEKRGCICSPILSKYWEPSRFAEVLDANKHLLERIYEYIMWEKCV